MTPEGLWQVDPVLHARLERLLRPRGLGAPDWCYGLLRAHAHEHFAADIHASTVAMAHGRNFPAIDDPCGLRMDLRVTQERATGILHVREMHLGRRLVYVNYGYDEGPFDGDDADEIWNRPIVLVRDLTLPDSGCAALAGRRMGEVAQTGLDELDGRTIEWASVVDRDVSRRLLEDVRPYEPLRAALVVRLADAPRVTVDLATSV
jgi:hypothetical protein